MSVRPSVRRSVSPSVRNAFFSDEPNLSVNELEGYQRQLDGQRPDGEQHMVVYTNLLFGSRIEQLLSKVGKKWKGRLVAKAKAPTAKPLDARQLAAVLEILRQPPR